MTYTPDAAEPLFLLNDVIGWQRLFDLPDLAHADTETCAAILTEGARFVAREIAPLNALGDREGCQLENGSVRVPPAFRTAFTRYAEGGWGALDLPEAIGGQALPFTLNTALSEFISGGCIAFGMLPCSTRAAAHLLVQDAEPPFSTDFATQLGTGEVTATIVITEPQAGTDVRAIRTRAEPAADGTWRVTGTKIFITGGDHDYTRQILHIVLAQTRDALGADALSLFVVPRWMPDAPDQRNAVSVVGIERKMGLKASPTCQMAFEGAVGWRIGEHGEGLRRMFTMMNLMRMDVAAQSVGIAQAATAAAEVWAQERRQGGDPTQGIVQFADVRRMLAEMRSLADAGRALLLETSMHLDLSHHATDASDRKDAVALSQFLLPVCKAWLSDQAVRVANLGVQIMGGHGYISDNGMEQYLRDCRIMGIYEGANGIQARDLVMRKLRGKGTSGCDLLLAQMRADLGARACEVSEPFAAALDRLQRASDLLASAQPATAEAAATAYLHLAGVVSMGWMWLRIAHAAEGRADAAQKIGLARFFAGYILPESALYLERIETAQRWL